jgi:arsenite methyltransferase
VVYIEDLTDKNAYSQVKFDLQDMLARAHANLSKIENTENISFVKGKISSIPLDAGIADCVISNCVINLVPLAERASVFTEMARVLKCGGRVAISDTLEKKPLTKELKESVAVYVGCVAGCSPKEEYERWLIEHGFGSKSTPADCYGH